jgi:hypothetical protein
MKAEELRVADEAEERTLRILVESMVRAGYSEREIVKAVNDATAEDA